MKLLEIRDLYLLLAFALIRVAGWLPSSWLKGRLAATIGRVAFHLSRSKRRLSQENISRAFAGKLTEAQIRKIVKGSFHEFWRETFSLLLCRDEKAALESAQVHGIERVREALAGGRGVILWECGSFGHRNLAKQMLREKGFSLHQVHAEQHLAGFGRGHGASSWVRDHVLEPAFERWEKQFVAEIIYVPRSESLAFTRTLLSRLRDNAILCVAGDGKFGEKPVAVEFLGQTDFFATGMVSLARLTGAPLLPVFCPRERNGETRLIIEAPIRVDKASDREQNVKDGVTRYAGLLESYIRKYPDQYWSWHHLGEFYERQERNHS